VRPEAFDPFGPAWRRFARWLPEGGAAALGHAQEALARQIQADGITHNVYGDEGAAARPWSLELLPALIEPGDWAQIEAGAVQRARLLDAMLADLYGEQRLLHEGLVPPALLFRHPGYLRPLHGAQPAGGVRLHIVAFDLARGAHDGRWQVLAQRTQGPSGLGYVLHNRLLVSRAFADAFRELRVQHIASGYRRLLDTVEALTRTLPHGPAEHGVPRIVLLTPGPANETYFEHAYLARYLGVPLVEGGDLMVKGERLWLKTVEGLEPVHGVLRRLDDDYCDPLELRPDSTLGVPALLQAVRAGGVAIANALGSGFLESPAVQAYLGACCERLLGERLRLPSLPSWWCGDDAAWAALQGGFGDKLLRRSFPRRGDERDEPKARSLEQVAADREAWTAQARLEIAATPLWREGALEAIPSVLRVYAIADGAGRWHLLPGGMTRVATGDSHSVSMQRGGSSLDTWVMTTGAVDRFTMLPARLSVDDVLARHRPVSSRTAENLFWLGRYTERAEQLVRLMRATLSLLDADSDAPPELLAALSPLAEEFGLVPARTPSLADDAATFERHLLCAATDAHEATSLGFDLHALSNAAAALRDRLAPEHAGLLRALVDDFAELGTRPTREQLLAALDRMAVQLAAITGAQSDRMTRDHGWRLLTVGRQLERLIGVASQLGLLLDAIAGAAGAELLLELADSALTYRARYQRHHDLVALVDLLVLDNANPRAWGCVLRRLRTELRKLPGSASSLDELVSRLPQEGAGLTLDDLRTLDEAALLARLRQLSERLVSAGMRLSDDIGRRYFAHAEGGDRLQQV
jgi:uncharacterized circularly permuted ATP-grasp superfamily protein/uncharacterized alpha-E superfamily protein